MTRPRSRRKAWESWCWRKKAREGVGRGYWLYSHNVARLQLAIVCPSIDDSLLVVSIVTLSLGIVL